MFDTSDDQIGSDKKTSSIQIGTTNTDIFLPPFMPHFQQHPMCNIIKLNVPHHSVSLCDRCHLHSLLLFCCACGKVGGGDYINVINEQTRHTKQCFSVNYRPNKTQCIMNSKEQGPSE